MATLTLGSKVCAEFIAGATRSANTYWMRAPHPSGEAREFEDITAEATDGVEKADHGFRGRVIGPILLMIVASSQANLISAYNQVKTAVENKPDGISIIMPYGSTYANCYVLSGYPMPGPRESEETGNWYQLVELMFKQERE